jgi:hypothetical protein
MQDKNLILAKIYTRFKILVNGHKPVFGLILNIKGLNISYDKCEYESIVVHNSNVLQSFMYNRHFPYKSCKLYELSCSNLYKIYQYLNTELYE